ncbi:MAG: ribose 5-phosphate isomerase B [Bdellovibrionales bacterium]|nr:ribose 5-phosphate isomerase B [Bdellovibrionales bacterium]
MLNTVLIASDHAGFALKSEIQKLLPKIEWMDLGPANSSRVDYPDYAERVADQISKKKHKIGVLICGSGIGMSIAANKIAGVRAALVENPVSARLAREHNDANIICIGSRFLAPEYAAEIIETFLKTPASTDERHRARVEKISKLEGKN